MSTPRLHYTYLGKSPQRTPTKLWKYKTVVYTVLKALVVLLTSFRFIIFYMLKSNELLLLYRARSSTCPILSDHSHSYVISVLCRFQCIYYRSSFPPFQVRKNTSPPSCRCFLLYGNGLYNISTVYCERLRYRGIMYTVFGPH